MRGRTMVGAALAAVGALLAGAVPAGAADEPVVPPTAEACVVHELHRVFLDRDATAEEVEAGVARLGAGEPTSRLAAELAGSDEWLGAQVDALYQQALDRNADPTGRAHWIGELRRGVLVARVASQLFGSQEVWQRVGQDAGAYVDDLYLRILGRPADAGGRAHWVAEVARLGRGRVAASFVGSVESRTDRVEALYQSLLGRPADAAGRAHWVDALRTVNDVRLAVLLAGSSELRTRAALGACAGGPVAGTLTRASLADDEAQAPSGTALADITPDGRHVAFISSGLTAGEAPVTNNVYVRDTETGTTTLVTTGIGGPANANSNGVDISADGSRVAFSSIASNLVAGDTNGTTDVFVWERSSGTITRVSVASDEEEAEGLSSLPSISPDGGYVAFSSYADNLDDSGATPGWPVEPLPEDVYLRDLAAGTTTHITVTTDGVRPRAIGGIDVAEGGAVVAFSSYAANLVAGDTNGTSDVFVWERETAELDLVTTDTADGPTDGTSWSPFVTDDGTKVAFTSEATDLVAGDTNGEADAFVLDREAGTITLVSDGPGGAPGDGDVQAATISPDGTHVGFDSDAANLVPGDANGARDAFLVDLATGAVVRLSRAPGGRQANGDSSTPFVGTGGAVAVFRSAATNLVAGDTNGKVDAFVWRPVP